MRYILAFISCTCLASNYLYAQNDSIYIEKEEATQNFNSTRKYRYIDHTQLERKTMFKYSLQVGDKRFNVNDRVSVERKIFPSLSVEGGVLLPRFDVTALYAQLRYYPSKRANSKLARHKENNFTGNYLSISTARGFDFSRSNEFNATNNINYVGQSYGFSIGSQQKIGKWGFADLSLSLDYFSSTKTTQVGLKMLTGLGYGRSVASDNGSIENKYNEFKDTYTNKRALFKISDPVFSVSNDFNVAGFSVGYERYVLKNLSFNSTVNFSAMNYTYPDQGRGVGGELNGYSAGLDVQFRYYYSHNKRMRRGANPTPFSGPYIALGVNDLYRMSEFKREYQDGRPSQLENITGFSEARINLLWGIQQRIGRRGFFNVSAGVEYNPTTGQTEFISKGSIGLILGK